ncbi:MAG: hypothetical protein JWM39_652 [Parcubacteria group bacterium]|jgi:mRNA interferase MazF|nr:hypothetical protein [Parcubacteria group bacterium]
MVYALRAMPETKDFDTWNESKKLLDTQAGTRFTHAREVWWCSLGVNIGAEIDGKNENFERPVVIMKVYNRDMVLVLPLTSKKNDNRFHCSIRVGDRISWAKLTQIQVISTKRLLRKIDMVNETDFKKLKRVLINSIN